jgi:hypothetical protein
MRTAFARARCADWCSSHIRRAVAPMPLCYSIFGGLYRTSLDDLPSWLCLEYCRLLCERIDALPRPCGGLLLGPLVGLGWVRGAPDDGAGASAAIRRQAHFRDIS